MYITIPEISAETKPGTILERSAPKTNVRVLMAQSNPSEICSKNETALIVGAIPERSAPKNNGSHLRHNTREISAENKASFIYGTIPQRSFMPQSQRDQRWKHIYVYLWLNPRRSQAEMAPLDNSVWQNSSRVK